VRETPVTAAGDQLLKRTMTRQDALNRPVIATNDGPQFLVLDELATFRGRRKADVAILVRRWVPVRSPHS
jgi:ATP-dependent helicase YprA (DUF1998 family)